MYFKKRKFDFRVVGDFRLFARYRANELINLEATIRNLPKSQMHWQLLDSIISDDEERLHGPIEMKRENNKNDYYYSDDDDDDSWVQRLKDKTVTFWNSKETSDDRIRKTQGTYALRE